MLSAKDFEKYALELTSSRGLEWQVRKYTDVFGSSFVYLHATCEFECTESSILDARKDVPQSSPTILGDAWESDDDVACAPDGPSSDRRVEVEYYITYNDAYCVPEIYFCGTLHNHKMVLGESGGSDGSRIRSPIYDADAWNAIFDWSFDTSGDEVPSTRPIIGAGYCESLGLSLFSLHQCDTEAMLKMAVVNGVKEENIIRLLIRLVGPMLRMPTRLLA